MKDTILTCLLAFALFETTYCAGRFHEHWWSLLLVIPGGVGIGFSVALAYLRR